MVIKTEYISKSPERDHSHKQYNIEYSNILGKEYDNISFIAMEGIKCDFFFFFAFVFLISTCSTWSSKMLLL